MELFFLQSASNEVVHEHLFSTGGLWAAIAALTSIIGLLTMIAFYAGRAHSRLATLTPMVDETFSILTKHVGQCDKEMALSKQRLDTHTERLDHHGKKLDEHGAIIQDHMTRINGLES